MKFEELSWNLVGQGKLDKIIEKSSQPDSILDFQTRTLIDDGE